MDYGKLERANVLYLHYLHATIPNIPLLKIQLIQVTGHLFSGVHLAIHKHLVLAWCR